MRILFRQRRNESYRGVFFLLTMPCFGDCSPLFTRSIKAQTGYNLSSRNLIWDIGRICLVVSHKLLYLHTDNSKAEVLRAAMLQKGFNLILVNSLREAKHRLLEDKEIELILCDLSLPDGTALELFHDIRRISEKFKVNNPPIKLLPFFILTASTDLATEYQYRHEGVSDYITAPVNIPELIRRILFFVE